MTESPELIETIISNPEIRRVAEDLWKDVGTTYLHQFKNQKQKKS